MKIPFDIKFRPQIESGEYKVETRDGRPARIVCWDRKSIFNQKLLVLVYNGNAEIANNYREDGVFLKSKETIWDLFIVTPEEEPELSEFEEALKDCVNARKPENPITDEGARNNATILLSLARKELEPEIKAEALKEIEQDPESSYAFKRGVEYGKEEALKDLPRWKPAAVAYDGDRLPRIDWSLKRLVAKFEEGIFYLDMNDLYKLPGFND